MFLTGGAVKNRLISIMTVKWLCACVLLLIYMLVSASVYF